MGAAPRVSVGMPIRNGRPLIADALRSVIEQTERDLEIIVSDNGSDDGTTELLQAAAAADPRIRYVRPDSPLRAYDNFRFVLRQARGEYFMWAAHDDTRDADFIARMIRALESNPDAVLAFGDLTLVRPGEGDEVMPFPFQTSGMGRAARLAKVSRLQCYHIYGVWRMTALRRMPYAYCDWWADLPMMLAAAVLVTFVHVPGTHFRYLELQKSGLARVKQLDFGEHFSLVRSVVSLVGATFRACSEVGGAMVGVYAASLVIAKQAINLPGFVMRRLGLARGMITL